MNVVPVHQRLIKQRRFRKILAACFLVSLIAGVVIVPIESHVAGSLITDPIDGLWWSIQTLTTVGYGDVVPITLMGRLLGILMQLVGAIGFGMVIALISSSMSRNQEEYYWNRLFDRINAIDDRLTTIEKHSKFLVESQDDGKLADKKVPIPQK